MANEFGNTTITGTTTTEGAVTHEAAVTHEVGVVFDDTIGADGIHNNGGTGSTGAVASGTYIPTETNPTNYSGGIDLDAFSWVRVGDIVMVSGAGRFNTITSANTATSVELSLPVASDLGTGTNFQAVRGSGGVKVSGGEERIPMQVIATTSDTIKITFYPASTSAYFFGFHASYEVA